MSIGQPCTWIQRYNGFAVTTYAVIKDIRPDGKVVLRYVGRSGKPVQRVANAASVVAR